MDRETLIHAIPLKVLPLPAAVKVPGFLTSDHCERLISAAERKGLKPIGHDRFGGESTTESCRLMPEDDSQIYEKFAQKATDLNAELWRLSVAGIYEPIKVLRYRIGDWIRPHIDADYRVPDTSKMTCTVQLVPSDSYRGGLLTIAETESFELDVGDAVFFPSHMLHTVSPVESGERTVVSAWIHGPAFQ